MERRDFSIATHVQAITTRTESETVGLSHRLLGHAWPGGPDDRSDHAALAWLRQWRPARAAAETLACACATGRCLVCN